MPATLRHRDLAAASKVLSEDIDRPFAGAPKEGRVSGYFALIGRAKNFTLVPWRQVMNRNLEKSTYVMDPVRASP